MEYMATTCHPARGGIIVCLRGQSVAWCMLLVIRYLGIRVYTATSRVFVWVLLASNSNIDPLVQA